MQIDKVEVVNLIDNQQYLEEVSKWIWQEWSKEHGAKLEDIIYRSKHSINANNVPQMYIAKYKNEVIGVVSIWTNDLTARQDLSPWMATLYVKQEFRKMGVGKKLQYKCIQEAKKMKYKNLYLITDHENYYEKTGWKLLEKAPLGDGNYTKIYQYNLENEK